MNILVTGVTSFIGRALVKELLSEGYDVYGIVRPTSGNKDDLPEKLRLITCDMNEVDRLERLDLPPMYACVHLAWDGIGKDGRANAEIQSFNKEHTVDLVRVSKKLGCARFLFAGSQAEYGVTLQRVDEGVSPADEIDERTACFPLSEYGKAKLEILKAAGDLCRELDMTYIHMRLFSSYGVGDHETSLVSACVRAFVNDEHISLSSCRQLWNYIHVRDTAKAIADLVSCVMTFAEEDEPEDHVVNVAGEDTRLLRHFVEAIHRTINAGSFDCSRASEKIAEGTPYLNPSIKKLKALTGFRQTVSFEEGIREIEEVYRMRG